eukprot:COSAG02_NODE_567_length_20212_cov_18.927460_7_plen_219_part_00
MRSVPDTIFRWEQQFHQKRLQHPHEQHQRVRFGGMFTSIPFWKLETYDRSREHPRLLEHCRTFKEFVEAMRTSLCGTVDVLADNAWVLVHCGPMRDNGRRCDLAFEIKKILQDDLGLELIDEIVLAPPHNTNLMRAGTLYESHCKLINANTRIVVAWKVSAATHCHAHVSWCILRVVVSNWVGHTSIVAVCKNARVIAGIFHPARQTVNLWLFHRLRL